MPDGNHMDAQRIYYLTAVHLFKCSLNLGPRAVNMLQASRYLSPALPGEASAMFFDNVSSRNDQTNDSLHHDKQKRFLPVLSKHTLPVQA